MDGRETVLSQRIPCGQDLAVAGENLQIVQKINQGGVLGLVLSKTEGQATAFEVEGMISAPQGIFLSVQLPTVLTTEDSQVNVWILKIVTPTTLMVPTDAEFAEISKLSRPKPIQPLLESLIGFF